MGKLLRVLIIDDSEVDAHLLLGTLRAAGYEVTYEIVRRKMPCVPRWNINLGI